MPNNASFTNSLPVFYSFRRCAYAMRARLAICYAGIRVELREIQLRHKPDAMLASSPKGTVPVLVLPSGKVIDESLDIMLWALAKNDPNGWLSNWQRPSCHALIKSNDGEFKYYLDRYKYADRHPEHPPAYYREQGALFLTELEQRLQHNPYLSAAHFSITDAAIAPFIRQFAAVDNPWFSNAPYPNLRRWLHAFLDSALFNSIMSTYKPWTPDSSQIVFGLDTTNNSPSSD